MKSESAALMSMSSNFVSANGVIHISNCRDEKDIDIIRKLIPTLKIAVDSSADKSVYHLIAKQELIIIPMYRSPFALTVPEEPTSEIFELVEKINLLYLPTVFQSLPEKLVDAFGLIVIGKLPEKIVSDKLAYLKYNNIQPETIPVDLQHLTTLTHLDLRMTKPRDDPIFLPTSLKHLDIEIQDNLDGFCIVENDKNRKGIKELNQLTSLQISFSDATSLTLPTSIKECSLEMCNQLKEIHFDNVNQLTRLEVRCCDGLKDMKLPSSLKLCTFQNCRNIKKLDIPEQLKKMSHMFDPSIQLHFF